MFRFIAILFIILATDQVNAGEVLLRPSRSADALVSTGDLDQDLLSRLVLEETNHFRESKGRGILTAYRPLMKAAQAHAEAMAVGNFFDHRNPNDARQRSLADRIRRVDIKPRAYAENIALSYSRDFRAMLLWDKKGRKTISPGTTEYTYRELARSVVEQWINSSGHRANLLSKLYTQIGLGFASAVDERGFKRIYGVQTFCAFTESKAR